MDRYYSASTFYEKTFGTKIYKLAVDAGCTCPTRDGTKGTGGCIFCSERGSGEFAANAALPVRQQLESAQELVRNKLHGRSGTRSGNYIAYFQNFTNTYGDHNALEAKYRAAIATPCVVGIAIATRPDCLDADILRRIAALCNETFVSIELGLQTANDETACRINRGYPLTVYDDAVRRIKKADSRIHLVTHIIFGLPGETTQDMLNTVRHVAAVQNDGVKCTVLHVLKNTPLETMYAHGDFTCMTKEAYFDVLAKSLTLLPAHTVIHRLTGDGDKKLLIAPLWTADKKRVRNDMTRYFVEHNIVQGSAYP